MATDNTNQPTAEAPSPAPQQPQPATPGQGPTPTAAPQNAYQSYQSYGGAYNQYAYNPVAYQPQPYTIPQPAPAVVEENKAWIKAKLVLHGAGIVFGICTLGMGLSYVGGNDGYFAYLAAIACPVVSHQSQRLSSHRIAD